MTALLPLILLSGPAAAAPQTITINADRDNTLFESADGSLSNGAGDGVFTGRTEQSSQSLRRALFHFDVGNAIPRGSVVSAARLELYVSRTKDNTARPVTVHAALADWGEGTSDATGEEGAGAPSRPGDATWIHTFWDTDLWTVAGGDFDPTASASTPVGREGLYTWSSAGLVLDVQGWVDDPSANLGWLVRGVESQIRTAKRFESRTSPDVSRRPRLVVTYEPPGVAGECCFDDGSCSVQPGPDCALAGGTYGGNGTDCTPNVCPQPTGACCLALGACEPTTFQDCLGLDGIFQGEGVSCGEVTCPVLLTPFVDPLPIPVVARPVTGQPGGAATYRIAMRETLHQFHSDLSPAVVWGFDDGTSGVRSPGPTIVASEGLPIQVTWANDLRDVGTGALRTSHYFGVDNCLHGAADDAPRAIVHLHGGHVPTASDGYPEDAFLPGSSLVVDYPNTQEAASLWYHDHAIGITRLNVMMGLAGLYAVRDANEQSLGLPSGAWDIPLAIQDRSFHPDGSLAYSAADPWADHFFGDNLIVNGKVSPVLAVDRGKYRFRVLNGCNSRTLRLSLSNGASFLQIATDGGLRETPLMLSSITLHPGERAELIVDFAPYPAGTEIVLTNDAPAPFPGDPGVGVLPDVLKFVVGNAPGHVAAIPPVLNAIEPLDPVDSVADREFVLAKTSDPCTGQVWMINGLHWDDVTEFPELDTVETWTFVNTSGMSHPMHMHLVLFQVLARFPVVEQGGGWIPSGPEVPPQPFEEGWKDTVDVAPGSATRVIARFTDYTGRYAYHCHILEHEDQEMMRQFQTVDCGNDVLEPTEQCDDGNELDGDACTADCLDDGDIDGITDDDELLVYFTDPLDADTDDDGLTDGREIALEGTEPLNVDSDRDGVQDGTEVGLVAGHADTDRFVFVPDADPLTTTLPLDPDTDGGGALDGEEDGDGDGAEESRELDPLDTGDDARMFDGDGDGACDWPTCADGSLPYDCYDGGRALNPDDDDQDGFSTCAGDCNDNDDLLVACPGEMHLLPATPGIAGTANTWYVTDGLPGDKVKLVYGAPGGTFAVPGCPGLVVAVGNPKVVPGSATVNGNGAASFQATIPASAKGFVGAVQVVDVGACVRSNVIVQPFY